MPQLLRDLVSLNENVVRLEPAKLQEGNTLPVLNTTLTPYAHLLGKGVPEGWNSYILTGIYGQSDEKNRNGRVYSKNLWRRVTESNEFRGKLSSHNVIGNLAHPDYTEPSLIEGAIIVTDLSLDESTGTVVGTAIPAVGTYHGDLLVSWLNLGVKPAVSSRGLGDVVTRNGVDYVNEDTYAYICHDLTLDPSVATAFPTVLKKESLEQFRTEVSSLLEKYAGKLSEADMKLHNRLMESVNKHPNLTEALQDFCACNFPTAPTKKLESVVVSSIISQKEPQMPANQEQEKVEGLVEKIEQLTRKNVETSEKVANLTTENSNLRTRVGQLESMKVNYEKTIAVVEDLTGKLSSERTRAEAALKENEASTKKLATAEAALREMARRYKVLESAHNSIMTIPAKYQKALEVIQEMRKRYFDLKKEATATSKKLDASADVAVAVADKLRREKVEKILAVELESVGGPEKFAALLEGVRTPEEAMRKAKAIKENVATPKRASFIPNFGAKKATDLKEEKKEEKTHSLLEEFSKKKNLSQIFNNVR